MPITKIQKGKINAKKYSRAAAIEKIKEFSVKNPAAVFHVSGGYLVLIERCAPMLYGHALDYGHQDPDFIGFYGGISGYKFFDEDTQRQRAAA